MVSTINAKGKAMASLQPLFWGVNFQTTPTKHPEPGRMAAHFQYLAVAVWSRVCRQLSTSFGRQVEVAEGPVKERHRTRPRLRMLPALVGCFSREAVEFIGQCYPPIADELVFSDRLALAVAGTAAKPVPTAHGWAPGSF